MTYAQQTQTSLHWGHRSVSWFCCAPAQMIMHPKDAYKCIQTGKTVLTLIRLFPQNTLSRPVVTQTMLSPCKGFSTDFIATAWWLLWPLQPLFVHIWNKGMNADQSAIGFETCQRLIRRLLGVDMAMGLQFVETALWLVGKCSVTGCNCTVTGRRPVDDQSPIETKTVKKHTKIHIKMCLSEMNCFSASCQDVNSRTVAVAMPAKNTSKCCSCIFWWLCRFSSLFLSSTDKILMIKQ